MNKPQILRKRYIPSETVDISGDELLYRDEEILITRWKTIRPRKDFSNGISFAFLKEGYKISKFFDSTSRFLYWYCDIIDVEYNEVKDIYTFSDLLLDLKVFPKGTYRILDTDELAEALEKGLVTQIQACRALRNLHKLLELVYDGKFPPEICKKYELNAD